MPFLFIIFAVPGVPHNEKFNSISFSANFTPSFLCLSFKEIKANPFVGS